MKLTDLPEFAKPYKKRGYDVRLRGGSYQLFRISSKRVEGKSYPVLLQEYIGVIHPDGSLKRKAEPIPRSDIFQEFALSDFLMKHYGRLLHRSIFNTSKEFSQPVISLAILLYIYGTISDTAISRCRLTATCDPEMLSRARELSAKRIERLCSRIAQEQAAQLGEDLAEFEMLMRLCVVDQLSVATPPYPDQAVEILKKHGVTL